MVADRTYYDLLEVSIDADEVEIKRAYKRKAMLHHPDKNPDDPQAHEMFQKIGQAYETLCDPNNRAAYDEYGPDGAPRGFDGGVDMDDIFAEMFGGASFGFGGGFSFDSAGPGPSRRKPTRGPDTVVDYNVTLEEAYKGKRVVMGLERDRVCSHCHGSGARTGVKPSKCKTCDGKGSVIADRHLGPGLVGKMKVTCTDCHGEGTRLRDKEKCKKCKGAKVLRDKKRVEFHIQPGTEDGERIALKGEGDEAPDIPPGDVIFHIHHKTHPFLRPHPSHPSNLRTTVRISLSEALLGFSRVFFVHLDGRGIRIDSGRGERVINPGDEWLIRGEGMPRIGREDKGDLYVKFEVEMPGASWAARQDPSGTTVQLPPALPEMSPLPDTVETRYLSPVRR
ncbi:chaperone regulator [Kockovaella imperatae]|uniref:Chaperone regulator n=1 Tax=Kockovaella imperatae TaxID=4999 RepID=A0A1Y1UIE2_9TREE|nr:chaperone regulator [Kockovaella imperatae]ORX36865.1 chaperone regulator [Kockovaella imperatae]